MATPLVLPDRVAPSNLHLREGVRARFVESDLFDIADRLRELSDRLFLVELTEQDDCSFVVMEMCEDGTERVVFRVKELDARVIARVREIMFVPFEHRFAAAEAAEEKHNAERADLELEQLYETVGRPMLTQLEHDGFIQRTTSYGKRGLGRTRPR